MLDVWLHRYFTALMRRLVCWLAGGLILAGCASDKDAGTKPTTKKRPNKVIVTPDNTLIGKVVRVNNNVRIAVLNFPIGKLPPVGSRFNVYRQGLKVGEIKVSGPQQDENIVADIATGEVQVGDELRAD
jgi:hypothetical protein